MGSPAAQPPARKTIDTLVAEARARLQRLEAHESVRGARSRRGPDRHPRRVQRVRDGVVPGAPFFPRNVLAWPGDPPCRRATRVGDVDTRVVVMCDERYRSSVAAGSLRQLGFVRATDVACRFQAWPQPGLSVRPPTEGGAMRAIDCPCGHHLQAVDEELFRLRREHVDREHHEMQRTDAQIRERVAADAYDLEPVA